MSESTPRRIPWLPLALVATGLLGVSAVVSHGCTSDVGGPRADGADARAGAERHPGRDPLTIDDGEAVAPAAYELAGRVVDEQGKPVPGARVWLEAHASRPSEQCPVCDAYVGSCFDATTAPRFFAQLVAHRHAPLAEQLTDADGTFRFVGVRQDSSLAASEGDRFADGDHGESEELPDGGSGLVLTLRPPARVALLVQHEDETPFVGAEVQLHHAALGKTLTGRSDGAGRFVATLPPGELFALVDAPGHRGVLVSGHSDDPPLDDAPQDGPTLMATLARERRLVISTRSAGRPVDADVVVGPARDQAEEPSRRHALTLRTTGGQVTVEHLWADSVLIEARAGGLVGEPTTLYLDEEQEEVTLELRASASLSLTLVDEQGDASEANVQVTLSSSSSTFDRGGPMQQRFEFGPLPEGEYELFVHAGSMRPLSRRVDLVAGPNQLELTLRRQLEVTGKVESAMGAPLGDVRVQLSEQTLTQGAWNSTSTDEAGAFTLEVPEDGTFTVSLWHPEHGKALAKLVAGAPPRTIRLEAGATLEITVRDDEGRALTGAQVRCETINLGFSAQETDAEGRARFAGVGGQDVELWVSAEGVAEQALRVTVAPTGTTRQTVVVQREALIHGVFVDAQGRPAEGYTLCDGVACNEATPVDPRPGAFAVRWPRGKPVKLAASHLEGGTPGPEVSARAPMEGLRLLVPTPRQVRGRVQTGDGAPLRRFEVSGHTFTAADGRFTVPAVSPELDVTADGYELQTVKVPEKGDDLGTITLAPLALVRGVVLSERGPVAGATVASPSFEGPPVQTRADGSFEARLLGGEPALVTATRGSQSAQATVTPGKDVVLRLQPGTVVHGLVVGAEGRPTAAEVTILPQGDFGMNQTVPAGADGRFVVELPAGRFAFATRAMGAGVLHDVAGPRMDVVLSVAPDRCTFTLGAPVALDAATLVPGAAAESADRLLQRPPTGAVLLARSFDGRSFRGAGVGCGPHTLVWCAYGECHLERVDPSLQPELTVRPTQPLERVETPSEPARAP